MKRQQLQRDCH